MAEAADCVRALQATQLAVAVAVQRAERMEEIKAVVRRMDVERKEQQRETVIVVSGGAEGWRGRDGGASARVWD